MRSFFLFWGRVQLEVVSALLSEKYKLETVVKEPTVIYMERPLKAASHTIHIEVPPNPFWASIGLSVTPLPLGSGVQYESRVSLGYLNQSFQNAVRDGIRYGLEQGLFGWNVTDCKICFEYGLYYSPVSTPADFRSLAPIVLEQALKESGTQLLEPYLSFTLYAPREYLSRAYHDAPKYCATIETVQVKKDEVVFTGEIPARCIQAYRTDLAFYTNGAERMPYRTERVSGRCRQASHPAPPSKQPPGQGALYVSEDNVTSCAMQAFIAGYCEISLIKSVSERRNYFEPGTDEYYNRKANTSSANTIGNDTGRTSRGIECYPAGTIELGERC